MTNPLKHPLAAVFALAFAVPGFAWAEEKSLYEQIGGQEAVNAAVDLFYVKVLADERINFYFEDVNMTRQANKQKQFIAAALGGPVPYEGKDMRSAHASLDGLDDSHFDAVAENLQATLEELGVAKELVAKVMAVVETTRGAVLGRDKDEAAGKPAGEAKD